VGHALALARDKARRHGIGCVGTRTSNHAGPASLYMREAVTAGYLALYFAVGNANHLPPWGGLDLLLSTNPIAIGVPAGEEAPVVLDKATTVAAYGKVKAKAQRGEALPEGWMIDRQGRPLTDPARVSEGVLLPIGGYKGYGLALMVGLLAGTLNGAAMGKDVIDFNADHVTVTNTGQLIVLIDPAAFGDAGLFRRQVDQIVRQMREGTRLPGVDRIWLPGEQSHLRRLRHGVDGVPLPDALRRRLDALAVELGVAPLG
jgi:LDH2 family malate/lactate/ureidoglycolate dehydrogenase